MLMSKNRNAKYKKKIIFSYIKNESPTRINQLYKFYYSNLYLFWAHVGILEQNYISNTLDVI